MSLLNYFRRLPKATDRDETVEQEERSSTLELEETPNEESDATESVFTAVKRPVPVSVNTAKLQAKKVKHAVIFKQTWKTGGTLRGLACFVISAKSLTSDHAIETHGIRHHAND